MFFQCLITQGNTIKLTERLTSLVEKKTGLNNSEYYLIWSIWFCLTYFMFFFVAIETLRSKIAKLETCVVSLEQSSDVETPTAALAKKEEEKKPAADDDDFDPFASDNEEDDAEAEKLKAERVAAYNAKKSKSTCFSIWIGFDFYQSMALY